MDVLVSWRCGAAHLERHGGDADALAELDKPPPDEDASADAVAGGPEMLGRRLLDDESGELRRAAEWSPAFAEGGFMLKTAAARYAAEQGGPLRLLRVLVVGADHVARERARAARYDYVSASALAKGRDVEAKIRAPEAEGETEGVESFAPGA